MKIHLKKIILLFTLFLLVLIAFLDLFIDREDSHRYLVVYIQAIVLGISILYLLKSYTAGIKKDPFHAVALLFIVMLVLYGLFTPNLSSLPVLLYGFTFFFPAYYFANQNVLTEKHLQVVGILLLLIYSYETYLGILGRAERLGNFYEKADNVGYHLLFLMPIFALNLQRIKNLLLLSITFILVMVSFKRGAMLAGGLAMAIAMWPFLRSKLVLQPKDRMALKFASFFIFLIITYFAYSYWEILIYRFVSDSTGSGRNILWGNIVKGWQEADFANQMFGHGLYKVIEYLASVIGTGYYAHSDWYELLYDHGIFGMIIYAVVMLTALISRKKVYRYAYNYYYSYLMILAIWLPKSYYSGLYINKDTIFMMLALGFILAKVQLNKKNFAFAPHFPSRLQQPAPS